jgi:rhodanese-related sulfurtransferase
MSEDSDLKTIRAIEPGELRRLLRSGSEIALLDVREGDRYASGHISVAAPLPDSEAELRVARLVPRLTTPVVLADDDGAGQAARVARRLADAGYTDVAVLAGGVAGWAAAGHELITGLNSLSKALGEFVERHYGTPRISSEELKARLDAGEDLVILDTRPVPEFTHISIPTGQAAPGVELLYRVFDRVLAPTTQVVINCAGRTRAIIGAQTLINASVGNPVVALENGTAGWQSAGLEPAHGEQDVLGRPTPGGLRRAADGAARIAARFGVAKIGAGPLAGLRSEPQARTVYLLDVRTPEEFLAGHYPGSRSAPGGQLVQATDAYIGTRGARVVLIDGQDAVRATVAASWLLQLGLPEVYVYGAEAAELRVTGPEPGPEAGHHGPGELITAAQLARALDGAAQLTVIDLEEPPPYYQERRYIPGSAYARRSALTADPVLLAGLGQVVLTSSDGALARLAAGELASVPGVRVTALHEGTGAWIAAGYPVQAGLGQLALTPDVTLPRPPSRQEREVTFAQYVSWGDQITGQLKRDGLVTFQVARAGSVVPAW